LFKGARGIEELNPFPKSRAREMELLNDFRGRFTVIV